MLLLLSLEINADLSCQVSFKFGFLLFGALLYDDAFYHAHKIVWMTCTVLGVMLLALNNY